MHEQLATIAEYFKLGVETGTLEASAAIQWADHVVTNSSQPLGDIAEVALCPSEPQLLVALSEVSGTRDKRSALHWLFGTLLEQLREGRSPHEVIQAAKHLVLSSGMDTSVHEVLCSISDSLGTAELGYYGTVEEAVKDLTCLLQAQATEAHLSDLC